MAFTDEQAGVINCQEPVIVVNAFAGTGKTYTLVKRSEAQPKKKIFCCVLNKSVADEARSRFPSNVFSSTSHSLAYGIIGKHYRHKLGEMKPYQLAKVIDLPFGAKRQQEKVAQVILKSLRNFMYSADLQITEEHVPSDVSLIGVHPAELMPYIIDVWNRQIDPTSPLPLPHDGYLKIFQLSQPKLPYDEILLDESQDLNPISLAIFSLQTHADQVYVGDSHQVIYAFRKSVDALKVVQSKSVHYLSQSFRFGPEVASVANKILQTFKSETVLLKGLGQSGDIGCSDHIDGHRAIIARTNAGVFEAACHYVERNPGDPIDFAGGIQGYGLGQIFDTYHLMMQNVDQIYDHHVKNFKSFKDMKSYADDMDDKELKSRIRVVERYKKSVPVLIMRIKDCVVDDADFSTATFTTAHKSKGLEWPVVKLWSDFPKMVDDRGVPLTYENVLALGDPEIKPLEEEEANLIYVAATRAALHLDPGESSLRDFLNSSN